MPISFRPARPDDADAAIPLIHSSGPQEFDYVTTQGGAAFLRAAFINGRGRFGYRHHSVGLRDGVIVAVGVGWRARDKPGFALAAFAQFVAHFGLVGAVGAAWRGLQAERVMRPPGRGEYYIGHLAVAPGWRGQGIGTQLVAHMLARGRGAGASVAVLDVACENLRAAALYSGLGFAVNGPPRLGFINRAGQIGDHFRMVRPLAVR